MSFRERIQQQPVNGELNLHLVLLLLPWGANVGILSGIFTTVLHWFGTEMVSSSATVTFLVATTVGTLVGAVWYLLLFWWGYMYFNPESGRLVLGPRF